MQDMARLIERRDIGFLAYWGITQVWRLFPPTFRYKHASSLSRLCARIWLTLSRREREQTLHNLRLMLNGHNPTADLEQISMTHHEAHVWAFLIPDILPRLSAEQIRAVSELRGVEHLQAALAQGRGAVLLSAHYGTHGYMIMAVLRAHGLPVTAVAGHEATPVGQDEPEGSWIYRKLVHPVREYPRTALPFISRGLVPDPKIARVLRDNEVLWIQGDMHLTEEQIAHEQQVVPVPFLWGAAPLRSGPVRLPKVFRSPVLPCFGFRDGSRVIVEIEAPLELRSGNSYEDAIADLRAYLDRLEPRILAAPDQWAFTRHDNLPQWIRADAQEMRE
jgi:KDO2-lipid IV(A) lauroyltransferase